MVLTSLPQNLAAAGLMEPNTKTVVNANTPKFLLNFFILLIF